MSPFSWVGMSQLRNQHEVVSKQSQRCIACDLWIAYSVFKKVGDCAWSQLYLSGMFVSHLPIQLSTQQIMASVSFGMPLLWAHFLILPYSTMDSSEM
jgi:hypothetical protein